MGEQAAAGSIKKKKRGRSSVGRAPALQAGGQEFESLRLHCENYRFSQRKLFLENRIQKLYKKNNLNILIRHPRYPNVKAEM